MRKVSGILIGLCLIGCGLISMLCLCGILDCNVSLDGWWTLFIIIPCLNGLVTGKDKIGPFIGLIVGILLFLAVQGVFSSHTVGKMIVPIIIVMVGLKILVTSVTKQKNLSNSRDEMRAEEHMALFTETTVDYDDTELTAAKIGAVFGGTKCNLTNAAIREGGHVDILCLFGGAELTVPDYVNIKNNVFCLFGGLSDKRALRQSEENPITLTINGFCMFGGVDIK